jgi:hypothetical protein
MSILESIKISEEKAEQLKNKANLEVQTLLEETRLNAEIQVKKLFDEVTQNEKDLDQEYLNNLANKEKEIKASYLEIDKKVEERALRKIDVTVDYIIKKVLLL